LCRLLIVAATPLLEVHAANFVCGDASFQDRLATSFTKISDNRLDENEGLVWNKVFLKNGRLNIADLEVMNRQMMVGASKFVTSFISDGDNDADHRHMGEMALPKFAFAAMIVQQSLPY
jgi:hypothetical protein